MKIIPLWGQTLSVGLAWHKLSVAACVLSLGGGLQWKELKLGRELLWDNSWLPVGTVGAACHSRLSWGLCEIMHEKHHSSS